MDVGMKQWVTKSMLVGHGRSAGCLTLGVLSVLACSSRQDVELPQVKDGEELACYRGGLVVAERENGRLLVDGDLEIAEAEADCGVDSLSLQGRRAPSEPGSVWGNSTYGVAWPGGVVPFEMDSEFTETETEGIQAAMELWSSVAPGVSFREKTGTDASYVSFQKISTGKCSSGYGRISGARTVKLRTHCTESFSVHHEIGHALGLQHEHTRADRDDYVVVTSTTDNYAIDTGADLFDYDFDSVMHYPLGGAIELKAGITLPDGVTPGQRDHLSRNDIASMRAMYPVAQTQRVLFADTGPQPLCRLSGREQDIAIDYSRTSSNAGLAGSGNAVSTPGLTPGVYSATCTIKSVFWSEDYDYPNSSFTVNFATAPNGDIQTYTDTATVHVLSAGLIPILFG